MIENNQIDKICKGKVIIPITLFTISYISQNTTPISNNNSNGRISEGIIAKPNRGRYLATTYKDIV